MSTGKTVKLEIKKECVAVYSYQGLKYQSCKWVPGLSVEFPSDCVLVELPTIPKDPAEDKQEFATQDDQAKLYKHLNDRITMLESQVKNLERKDVTAMLDTIVADLIQVNVEGGILDSVSMLEIWKDEK